MIKSMTGYSHKKMENDHFSCVVDVKSLNSKFLDAQIRLPREFSDREIEVRTRAAEVLGRGKVSIIIEVEYKGGAKPQWEIDEEAFKRYYNHLSALRDEVGDETGDVFSRVMEIPEVSTLREAEGLEEHWSAISKVLEEAFEDCDSFRKQEGVNLEAQLVHSLESIGAGREQISALAQGRIERVRERIKGNLEALELNSSVDENRLEQEILYYLEKMDISEEIVRMDSHISFFKENLNSSNQSQGKKLGFITQEIGREINTIGSKANDAQMQKVVVAMKDELEKIKEQLSNVL